MEDRVADILEQRAHLESGGGGAFALSVLLHAALMGTAVYAALHQAPPEPVTMVSIRLAQAAMPAVAPARTAPTPTIPEPTPVPVAPVQKPKLEEPKAPVEKPAEKVEKNTVPLSPFGRSTKKGAETPDAAPVPVKPAGGTTGAVAEVPVGGSGITGLEGGDFPYTIYLEGMQRKIGSNWYRPQIQGGISVIIYFRIQRDGSLTDARVMTSSGNGTFDRQALSAVRSSSPLNPLPFGYNGTYLGVHLTFR